MAEDERPDAPEEEPTDSAAAGDSEETTGDAGATDESTESGASVEREADAPAESADAPAEAPTGDAAADAPAGDAAPEEPAAPEAPAAEAAPEEPAAPDAPAAETAPEEPAAPEAPTGDAAPAEAGPADAPAGGSAVEPSEPADAPVEPPAAEPAADAPTEPAGPGPAAADDAPAEPTAAADPGESPAAGEEPAAAADESPGQARRERPRRDDEGKPAEPDVVPGAHLEPDLVLEEQRRPEGEDYDRYAEPGEEVPVAEGEEAASVEEQPAARTPLDLAADARYPATGKRKRAIARVILKPGEGKYTINGKELDVYFPRPTLQKTARRPLETAGYETRMDVVARIHGGGVSAQATALRHGIARALVEADPNLRSELKRHGFLTRDARVKERKKAGLKKARKRPQFSKR